MTLYGSADPGDLLDHRQRTRGPTWFEIVSRLVLPIGLTLLAVVQDEEAELYLTAAVVVFGLSALQPVWAWLKIAYQNARTLLILRLFKDQISLFPEELYEFVDPQRSDTLHSVVSNIRTRGIEQYGEVDIIPREVLSDFATRLQWDVANLGFSRNAYVRALRDIDSFVRHYQRYCLEPVINFAKRAGRGDFPSSDWDTLQRFRERFVGLTDRLAEMYRILKKKTGETQIPRPYFGSPVLSEDN